MGVIRHRGQIVCDVRWPDKTRFTRVCANKTKAQKLLDRIKGAIAEGRWRELKERLQLRERAVMTLEEYSEVYLEEYARIHNKERAWRRKEVSLRALNKFLGRTDLDVMTHALLHRYVQMRRTAGVSHATINRDLTTLKHLLNYAAENNMIESNPVRDFKKLKEAEQERPRFTEEQIQRVIAAVRPDCRAMFTFIRETGCRSEEAHSLQHWQVQKKSKLVVFSTNTKSGKRRYVPLTETAN